MSWNPVFWWIDSLLDMLQMEKDQQSSDYGK